MALPKEAQVDASFVAETCQRSLPNPNRPRLSTASEARLAEVDRKDAVKYASMETIIHQLNGVADALDADAQSEVPPRDLSAIPEDGEWEDSMVHNIEEARAQLAAAKLDE